MEYRVAEVWKRKVERRRGILEGIKGVFDIMVQSRDIDRIVMLSRYWDCGLAVY